MCLHILAALKRCRIPHQQRLCSPMCHATVASPLQADKSISLRYESTQGIGAGRTHECAVKKGRGEFNSLLLIDDSRMWLGFMRCLFRLFCFQGDEPRIWLVGGTEKGGFVTYGAETA